MAEAEQPPTESVAPAAKSLDLFPTLLPKRIFSGGRKALEVDLTELAFADALPGEPSAQMVHSVERLGILVPITVTQDAEGVYTLIDGIRRVKAARKAGLKKIPVAIYEPDSFSAVTDENVRTGAIAASLVSNYHRAFNPALELRLFEQLLEAVTDREMAQQLGIPLNMVQRRLRLRMLVPGLRDALEANKLVVSVAEDCCSLPPVLQEKLVAILAEKGRLTKDDVRSVRQVQTSAAVASLSNVLFSGPSAEPTLIEKIEALQRQIEALAVDSGINGVMFELREASKVLRRAVVEAQAEMAVTP